MNTHRHQPPPPGRASWSSPPRCCWPAAAATTTAPTALRRHAPTSAVGAASSHPSDRTTPGRTATTSTGAEPARLPPQEDVFSVAVAVEHAGPRRAGSAPTPTPCSSTPRSARYGVDGQADRPQEVDEGVYINTRAWTVPVVADGVPTVVRCRQVQCGDGTTTSPSTSPTTSTPTRSTTAGSPSSTRTPAPAYDLWRARREDDGTISYQFMRKWDLDGPGFSQPYVVSARGSGLPLFAGLIRPGELERCQINHALAISVPGPAAGYFVQPASSTDGNGTRATRCPRVPGSGSRPTSRSREPIDPVDRQAAPDDAVTQRRYADCIVPRCRPTAPSWSTAPRCRRSTSSASTPRPAAARCSTATSCSSLRPRRLHGRRLQRRGPVPLPARRRDRRRAHRLGTDGRPATSTTRGRPVMRTQHPPPASRWPRLAVARRPGPRRVRVTTTRRRRVAASGRRQQAGSSPSRDRGAGADEPVVGTRLRARRSPTRCQASSRSTAATTR